MKKQLVCLAAVSIFAVACGPEPILTTPPAGKIGGTSWTMQKAVVTKNSAGDTLSIDLYGETVADCASSAPSGSTVPRIFWSEPAANGTKQLKFDLFDLSGSQTVTFYTPTGSNNNIITNGRLEVSNLSATSVTIGMLAKGSDSNDNINGTFTTNICP
jgi:hypothetical protein